MELKEAIEILERHNKWRRGAEIPQESPGELGIAIDTVLEAVMGKDEMDGTACPCCGSNKTYETQAIHCNHCAVTTEI